MRHALPVLLLLAAAARAGVIEVPGDFASLQAAVNAALTGDEIVVASGSYEETLLIDGKSSITLRGQGQVILRGGDAITATIKLTDCTDVTIERIGFEQSASRAVEVEESDGIRLSRCRIDGTGGNAVELINCGGTVIERCVIRQPGGLGIAVFECSGTLVSQCRIEEAGDSAIRISNLGNTIVERCQLIRPEKFGVEIGVFVSALGCAVLRNQIVEPGVGGLRLNGAQAIARENKIVRPGSVGIEVQSGGGGAILEGNLVIRPGDYGLAIFGANAIVRGNRVVKPGSVGVVADVSGLTLTDNTFVAPLGSGVDLQSGVSSGFVARNRVLNAVSNGFAIGASNLLVLENQALGCDGDGFLVSNGPNQIAHNAAKGSGQFDLNETSMLSNSFFDNSFPKIAP